MDNAKGTFPDNTLAWLDRDLAAHPKGKGGITTLIVAMHIPPSTEGIRPHGTRFDYEERSAKLLAILKRHGVDAVLSGHEHMQHVEDWEGVMVLISGGAGAPLVPFQKYGYYRIDVENGRVRETFRRVEQGPLKETAPGERIPRRRQWEDTPSCRVGGTHLGFQELAPPRASVPVSPSSLSSFHGGRTFRRTKRMTIGRASRTIA